MGQVDVHPNAQSQLNAPMSADISMIKDVSKLIIKHDEVLIKREVKSNINLILAEGTVSSSLDVLTIIKIGEGVKGYEVGDIVLDVLNPKGVSYMHRKVNGKEENYAKTNVYNINLATKIDNIE